MTKSRIFFILSLCFIGGVAAASFYYPKIINYSSLLISAAFPLILLAVFYKNKIAAVAGFSILFFIFAVFISSLRLEKLLQLDLNGEKVSGNFTVAGEPSASGKMQKLIIKDSKENKFLVNTGAYENYGYGDNLNIDCALSPISNEGLDFDYRAYLAKDGIYYECKKAKIEKMETNSGNYFYAAILKIKNKFNGNISRTVPNPEAGLLSGLLLGGNDKLSDEMQAKFSATGMTHIVAVSGYNVAIIAEYLMVAGIFLGLWRRQAFWLAVTGIIIFIIAIGLPSSAVRAGVMGILLIWAAKNGRLANSQNAILFSADIMLFFKPMLLRWDVGFQLSFLATLGIIFLYPIFQNYLVKKHKTFGFSEILFLTVSAQIFVLPIILFNFRNLSLVSIPANLMILPIVPVTMLFGFLAGTAGFVSQYVSQIFAWLAYLPLKYETSVIGYLAGLKYASLNSGISWQGIIIWYAILMIAVYFIKRKIQKQKWPIEK